MLRLLHVIAWVLRAEWLKWGVWVFIGVYVFTASTRFDTRYWELQRIVMVIGWAVLGIWFATGHGAP